MIGKPRNRIAWAGAWSRAYNNRRYVELLPRLTNVDRFYVDMHPWWPIRGIRRRIWLPLLVSWLGIRYPLVFSTDWRQIGRIRNRVVCDLDDPVFSSQEVSALKRANVAAVVVTTAAVQSRLQNLGVRNPIEVIPQGVATEPPSLERIQALRREWCGSNGEIVVGLHQPHFEFSAELPDGAVEQMYAVDALLTAMEQARKSEPRLVLWLAGTPSLKVREFAAGRTWMKLLGYRQSSALMDCVASFDIGVYPRQVDMRGRASIKVLEYMACGVPVVGFDVEEMYPVREGKAGMVVRDIPAFAAALVSLARSAEERKRLGGLGKKAAGLYDWDVLSGRYRALLDGLVGS
jgi:glycosyltransferase involved in cell wall biosynthesis